MSGFYRINLSSSADKGATFPRDYAMNVAQACATCFISSENWEEGYLVAPERPEDREVVERLLREGKMCWERVARPPAHLAPAVH